MKLCGIYKIHNQINNKIYIGKSIDILERWQQHIDNARLQHYDYDFYKDLKQINSFSFQILELCSEEQLQEKEQYYINLYNSTSEGYNQVEAIDLTKQERLLLKQNVLKAITLLETTDLFYKDIAERTNLSINTILNINTCKSYTQYHNYSNNIREECGKKQYYDKGELNPNSKLTEKEVLEIIDLLKNTSLTMKEIGQKFGVSRSAINNINLKQRWSYLTPNFHNNIRKESHNYYKGELKLNEDTIS